MKLSGKVFLTLAICLAIWMLNTDNTLLTSPTRGVTTNRGTGSAMHHAASSTNYTTNEALSFRVADSSVRVNETRTITLIMQFAGELGNNLDIMQKAFAFKEAIEGRPDLPVYIHVVGDHQDKKWEGAASALRSCFPNFRDFTFARGRWDKHFQQDVAPRQREWLGSKRAAQLVLGSPESPCGNANSTPASCIEGVVGILQNILSEWNVQNISSARALHNYSLPYLTASKLLNVGKLRNMEKLFRYAYNSSICCATVPDPEEAVFHLRAFGQENPKHLNKTAYREMTADRAVAFCEHQGFSKVAIASRFWDSGATQAYVDAMNRQGIQARIIRSQTGPQDFCFLQHAKRALVAPQKSTFAAWAHRIAEYSPDMVIMYKVSTDVDDFPPPVNATGRHKIVVPDLTGL